MGLLSRVGSCVALYFVILSREDWGPPEMFDRVIVLVFHVWAGKLQDESFAQVLEAAWWQERRESKGSCLKWLAVVLGKW